jgi:hypothetical protein
LLGPDRHPKEAWMAQQDRTEFERREPLDEDVVGQAEEEEFDEADEDMEEDEESEEDV